MKKWQLLFITLPKITKKTSIEKKCVGINKMLKYYLIINFYLGLKSGKKPSWFTSNKASGT